MQKSAYPRTGILFLNRSASKNNLVIGHHGQSTAEKRTVVRWESIPFEIHLRLEIMYVRYLMVRVTRIISPIAILSWLMSGQEQYRWFRYRDRVQ